MNTATQIVAAFWIVLVIILLLSAIIFVTGTGRSIGRGLARARNAWKNRHEFRP